MMNEISKTHKNSCIKYNTLGVNGLNHTNIYYNTFLKIQKQSKIPPSCTYFIYSRKLPKFKDSNQSKLKNRLVLVLLSIFCSVH